MIRRMPAGRILVLLAVLMALPAAEVHVKAGASGTGDGLSWANACPTLQAGLAKAVAGDQVWVAQGTYTPGSLRSSTFIVPSGVSVFGGFTGTETALAQRQDDPGLVVLSGEIGTAVATDNIGKIVHLSGSAVLDTLTVTRGYLEGGSNGVLLGPSEYPLGNMGTVRLQRLRFVGNTAQDGYLVAIGGKIGITMDRCEVRANVLNTTSGVGHALVSLYAGTGFGTGAVQVCNSVFADNACTPATSPSDAVLSGYNMAVTSCVFAANTGFEFQVDEPFATIAGCTVTGTVPLTGQAGAIRGCILATALSVTAGTVVEDTWIASTQGAPGFADAAHPPGADGVWFTADDGLRLQAASPCIDQAHFTTATSTSAMPLTDILGTLRPQGSRPDCGAYEFPTGNAGPIASAATVSAREDVPTPIVLTGSDADGDPLSARIASLPARGTLLPTSDGVTASGPALAAADLPYAVANAGRVVLFRSAVDTFATGYASFAFTLDDGQVESDPALVTVDVLSVNDGPTIDAPGAQTVLEDSGQHLVALAGITAGTPGLAVGDPCRETQVLSVVAMSSDPSIVADPTVSYTSPDATASLAFAPVANATGTATISVTVHDGGGAADGGIDTTVVTFTVTVQPVNDPPQMAPIANLTLPEDCTDPALTTVTITGVAAGPADEAGQALTFGAISSDGAVVAIAGIDHVAGASTAQLHLALAPDATGTVQIFVSQFDDGGTADGGSDATARVFLVTVTPVPDDPVLAVNTGLSAIAGQVTAFGPAQLRLTDADAPPSSSLRYTLASLPSTGTLRLSGVDLGVGGTFTQADVDALRLAYAHGGGVSASDAFTITWDDGVGVLQGPATVVVALTGSSLPVVTLPGSGSAWTEGAPAVAVAPLAAVSDADPLAWDHGSVTVTVAAGGGAGDVLSLLHEGDGAGELGVSGPALAFGGLAIGTWTGGSGGSPLVATFTTVAATPAAAQAVVRRLRFASDRNPGGATRTIRVVVNDGAAGASVPADTGVTVTPVDDPPQVAVRVVATMPGVDREFTLVASDPDSAALTWSLMPPPPAFATVTLIDPATGRFLLQPAAGQTGQGTMTVSVSDGVNPAVLADIGIVVGGTMRLHPRADAPHEAVAGRLCRFDIPFTTADLDPAMPLEFALSTSAPAGAVLSRLGPASCRVDWPVPSGEAVGSYRRFAVIAADATGIRVGQLPVPLVILAAPSGGG